MGKPDRAAPVRTTRWCVTVDTEEEWDWGSGYPTAPGRVTNVRRLPAFQELCAAHGAAVVYFVNHAVLADPDGAAVVRDLAARPNVEVGLHVHPWNTPPLQPGDRVPVRDSFLHNLQWPLARSKLETVLAAFDRIGARPTSFRGGRYSTSAEVQDFLRDRGVRADASVVPYTTWADDGAPDYRDRAPAPVRRPPRAAGDPALWELPLTLGYTRRPFALWHRVVRAGEWGPARHLRLVGLLDRLGVVRKAWLNLENPAYPDPAGFVRVVAAERPGFACATLHSSSLVPGGNPYVPAASDVERVLRATRAVLAAAARCPHFRPVTATAAADELEAEFHARTRH